MQLAVKDVARLLSVTEKTVYRWIQAQHLPAYRIEGQYRINRALLFEWATARKINFSEALLQDSRAATPDPSLEEGLRYGGIYYRIEGGNKEAVLRATVDLLRLPDSVDRTFLYEALLAREKLHSTGIGDGIAVPHVRNPLIVEVDKPLACLCFLARPVEFGALDGKPVSILFTLMTPSVRAHLHLLSRLSFCLQNAAFKQSLLQQAGREEILAAAQRVETALSKPSEPAV